MEEMTTMTSQWAAMGMDASASLWDGSLPVCSDTATFPHTRLKVMSLAMRHGIRIGSRVAVFFTTHGSKIPKAFGGICTAFNVTSCSIQFDDTDTDNSLPLPVLNQDRELLGGSESTIKEEEQRRKVERSKTKKPEVDEEEEEEEEVVFINSDPDDIGSDSGDSHPRSLPMCLGLDSCVLPDDFVFPIITSLLVTIRL